MTSSVKSNSHDLGHLLFWGWVRGLGFNIYRGQTISAFQKHSRLALSGSATPGCESSCACCWPREPLRVCMFVSLSSFKECSTLKKTYDSKCNSNSNLASSNLTAIAC